MAAEYDDMDPNGPGPVVEARRALVIGDQWVQDALHDLQRQVTALQAIKRDKKQPTVWLQLPNEVLKAFELGVLTKAEARKIMGVPTARKRPQPPQLARATAARRRR